MFLDTVFRGGSTAEKFWGSWHQSAAVASDANDSDLGVIITIFDPSLLRCA